jgi:hypothetical protein
MSNADKNAIAIIAVAIGLRSSFTHTTSALKAGSCARSPPPSTSCCDRGLGTTLEGSQAPSLFTSDGFGGDRFRCADIILRSTGKHAKRGTRQ